MVNSKLSVTAKPAAHVPTRSQPSASSSNIRQEMKLISKRVSDLEGSHVFAQEQIQERDERLFERQQNIAEDIAKGMSDGLDRQCTAWEAHHVFQLRSKNAEIEELQSRIARLEFDLQGRNILFQKLSEPHPEALVPEAEKERIKKETLPKADIIRAGANSFLRLL